ncbi:glutathione S-transferase [Pseudomonas typographi]|uniref:Glutathione S-transferase n=1 Tax=Pseudomonas typographi TaxID=2715964 RepID=A0ABR7Z2J6_9PSED|nr:glutathione S-transferase [Pseudomonas typographi]MBD1550315.1 glutathione S-transferase [Pseudomonas typographi]MBD1585919.1 glutathione S-transferase [Pseudomonas typographi]MBD1599715.1 glutathione S-transferase [Pseudomonas typographi]
MFKLYYASTSPYVRKVMVTAHCLGLAEQIEKLDSAAHPIKRDERIASFNPLAKVPALQTANGLALYDSRVICEYLDTYAGGSLFPREGRQRWLSLARQALGDGLLDAALLARYEAFARPADKQWSGWVDGQMAKIHAALAEIETQAPRYGSVPDDIGLITLGCGLGYLDFRFASLDWRASHPATAAWFAEFDQHPAMVATRPFE